MLLPRLRVYVLELNESEKRKMPQPPRRNRPVAQPTTFAIDDATMDWSVVWNDDPGMSAEETRRDRETRRLNEILSGQEERRRERQSEQDRLRATLTSLNNQLAENQDRLDELEADGEDGGEAWEELINERNTLTNRRIRTEQ